MECHYVKSFGVKIIENIFLPFSLGSAALDTSRNGIITASPGTLGLSTYLGFLTGPAVEQIWVWLIFSRCKQSFGVYSVCPHQDPNMPQGRAGPFSSLEHTVMSVQTRECPVRAAKAETGKLSFENVNSDKNKSCSFALKTLQLSLVYVKEVILTCSNLDSFWQGFFLIWNLPLTGTETIGLLAISKVRRQGLQAARL